MSAAPTIGIMNVDDGKELVKDKSERFAIRIIKLYKYLTTEKKEYVMAKQILRSGTGIGANLTEAAYAISKSEFLSKLYISLKETSETLYWLKLLVKTEYISETEYRSLYMDCEEIRKMLRNILINNGIIDNSFFGTGQFYETALWAIENDDFVEDNDDDTGGLLSGEEQTPAVRGRVDIRRRGDNEDILRTGIQQSGGGREVSENRGGNDKSRFLTNQTTELTNSTTDTQTVSTDVPIVDKPAPAQNAVDVEAEDTFDVEDTGIDAIELIPDEITEAIDTADVSEETKDEVLYRATEAIRKAVDAQIRVKADIDTAKQDADFAAIYKELGLDFDDDTFEEDSYQEYDEGESYLYRYYDGYRLTKEDRDLNKKSESDGNISKRSIGTIRMVEVPKKTKGEGMTRISTADDEPCFKENSSQEKYKVEEKNQIKL